ncbi:MAG: phospholipase D family protein [Burkholderiaceae bacterium]|jgi:putative cardiolipin synthase
MNNLLPHASRALVALLLCLGLGACGTLPVVERQASKAIPGDSTALGKAASTALDDSGQSGFRLLPNGGFALDARLVLANQAQQTLDAQYYLVQDDVTGREFLRGLRDAALRGVRVRLLLDDLYTAGEDELLSDLSATPNVQVRLYNPFTAGRAALWSRLLLSIGDFDRINHRMHNKLFIADDSIAISGGRNIADAYFARAENSDNFVDLDILSAGPVVQRLSEVFDRYWNDANVIPLEAIVGRTEPQKDAQARFDQLTAPQAQPQPLAHADLLGYGRLADELSQGRLKLQIAPARVLADSPEKADGQNDHSLDGTVVRTVEDAITQARSEIVIASPYVVPGKLGMRKIREARARGVHVVIITNSLAATDEPIVQIGYAHYRKEMLEMGVEIHELSPTLATQRAHLADFRSILGRLHAKIWVIDQSRVFVGSMNLDRRSAHLNTETGLIIESPPLAAEIARLLRNDLLQSAYRVELVDGHIQWSGFEQGKEVHYSDEPGVSAALKLELELISPLAPDSLM